MTKQRRVSLNDLIFSFENGELSENGGVISLSSISKNFREEICAFFNDSQHVLSIGAADGLIERELKQVCAIDLRPAPLLRCTEAGVISAQADAHSLPFGDNSFDAVLMNESIGQIDPLVALPETRRVLKPGGLLVLTTYVLPESGAEDEPFVFCEEYLASADENEYAQNYFQMSKYYVYPTRVIKKFLERAGFQVESLYEKSFPNDFETDTDMIVAVASVPLDPFSQAEA